MGLKTPTGNWARTPRVSPEEHHERAVRRRDHRNMLKAAFKVGDEAFYPPHRNRPTTARKHSSRSFIEQIRMFPGSGPISRLSMVR